MPATSVTHSFYSLLSEMLPMAPIKPSHVLGILLFLGLLFVIAATLAFYFFVIPWIDSEPTTIILSGARGDFVDPGPIEPECQKEWQGYSQSLEFKENGFSYCLLLESKVGYGDDECPHGWSPQGCYVCTLECK